MSIDKSNLTKTTRTPVETLRIVLAVLAALAAVSLLVLNIKSFLDAVNYYLAMGYPSGEVYKQVIPSQLIPGIFEPIAIYGGIAFLLFYVGNLNQKVSKCLASVTEADSGNDAAGESTSEPMLTAEEEGTAELDAIEEDNTEPQITD